MSLAAAPATLSARAVRTALGISRDRMGRLLEVTAKTIGRLEEANRAPASPAAATRLAHLAELVDLGLLVYTPEGLTRFVSTALPIFGGLTALQLIERDRIEQVVAELAAMHEGVPS